MKVSLNFSKMSRVTETGVSISARVAGAGQTRELCPTRAHGRWQQSLLGTLVSLPPLWGDLPTMELNSRSTGLGGHLCPWRPPLSLGSRRRGEEGKTQHLSWTHSPGPWASS